MVFNTQLARDLDIVLIDGTRPPVQTTTLPSGWLREPAIGLQRADAWVISGSMGQDDQVATAQLAGQSAGRTAVAAVHLPRRRGLRARQAVCGDGRDARPERVRALVEAGGIVAAMLRWPTTTPSHPPAGSVPRRSSKADALLTKDARRRPAAGMARARVDPPDALEVTSGEAALRQRVLSVLQTTSQCPNEPDPVVVVGDLMLDEDGLASGTGLSRRGGSGVPVQYGVSPRWGGQSVGWLGKPHGGSGW